MEILRYYLGCLSHASYIVHDNGEAAVVDPRRDIDLYLDEAKRLGLTIRWVLETHLHADFVSGHLELANRSGAEICMGRGSGATFPHRALNDEEMLPLGRGFLKVLATPGHTEESVCILALESDKLEHPIGVFTGDTLFMGDVGRPDLSPDKTPQQLAALLYDSLHNKLLTLPAETPIFPAHGAGSLCGRSLSNVERSTIGREQQTNYALQPMSREEFVQLITEDLPSRPEYFRDEVERNRVGAADLETLPPVPVLDVSAVEALQAEGAILLDTRPHAEFASAYIPGSVHIALSGQFASWAARLLGVENTRIILLAEDEAALEEARMRLARVGLEEIAGTPEGGIHGWIQAGMPVQSLVQDVPASLREEVLDPAKEMLIDVREPSEYLASHIHGAANIPLSQLQEQIDTLDKEKTLLVYCKGGYRSSIACSLLLARGHARVINLVGGYDAWTLAAASAGAAPHAMK